MSQMMGSLQSTKLLGPFGHDYGKLPFQTRSRFFHGGLVLIFCPHKIISFKEEWWSVRVVVSVRKRPNRFYMFFRVVGPHKMFGLGV